MDPSGKALIRWMQKYGPSIYYWNSWATEFYWSAPKDVQQVCDQLAQGWMNAKVKLYG